MKRKLLLISIVSAIALSVVTAWAGPEMNPGKWEITTKTTMAGMPTQSITHIQCITKEDLIPVNQDDNQECQVTDIVYEGNTVSWKISCGGQSGCMKGTGKVTYNGDSMRGTMHMTMSGSDMQINNQLYGRRIGTCDSSELSTPQSADAGNALGEVAAQDVKGVNKNVQEDENKTAVDEVIKGVKGFFK